MGINSDASFGKDECPCPGSTQHMLGSEQRPARLQGPVSLVHTPHCPQKPWLFLVRTTPLVRSCSLELRSQFANRTWQDSSVTKRCPAMRPVPQVPPKCPDAPPPGAVAVSQGGRDGAVPRSPRFKAVGLSPFLPCDCSSPGARVTPLLFCGHGHLPNVITRRKSIMTF